MGRNGVHSPEQVCPPPQHGGLGCNSHDTKPVHQLRYSDQLPRNFMRCKGSDKSLHEQTGEGN